MQKVTLSKDMKSELGIDSSFIGFGDDCLSYRLKNKRTTKEIDIIIAKLNDETIKKQLKESDNPVVIPYRITQKQIDADGEVVMPNGCNLERYKKNPIFILQHGYSWRGYLPIGKALIDTVEITEEYIDVDIMYDTFSDDNEAEQIAMKAMNGFINGVSPGFSVDMSDETKVMNEQTGDTIWEWTLYEISQAFIPANMDAVRKKMFFNFMKEKGEASYNNKLPDDLSELHDLMSEFLKKLNNIEKAIITQKTTNSIEKIKETITNSFNF
jgi:phage head maturation protease